MFHRFRAYEDTDLMIDAALQNGETTELKNFVELSIKFQTSRLRLTLRHILSSFWS